MKLNNLTVRIIVAIFGIPLIVFVTIAGKYLFLAFVFIISSLATFEYYTLVEKKNFSPIFYIGIISISLIDLAFYAGNHEQIVTFLILAVLLTGLVELFRKPSSQNWSSISNLATEIFPILYIGLSLGTLIGLRELKSENYLENGIFIISILAIIWICDTAAYFVGKSIGKRKLYERVSPKKTVEGFIGGLIFALLSSFGAKLWVLKQINHFDAFVIGLIVGIFGQLGDLVESLIKRDAQVKDSSNLIPGHGGVLDRFDSLIYVAPLVYLYMTNFK